MLVSVFFSSMKTSVFSTPLLTPAFKVLASLGLKLSGWKIVINEPLSPPYVIIAAPHSSNWDFLLMLATVFHLGMDIRWMGKHTLFPPFIAPISRWLGGIPINRNQAHNAVTQMVRKFDAEPNLAMLISPEGTRKNVPRWKTGFYHIARQAKVPIVMGAIDAERKEVRFLGTYIPTDNTENDLKRIQQYFNGFKGIR